MIIQGSNESIYLIFYDVNEIPASDLSVSLRNETTEFKHWGLADATISEDGLEYELPITQDESNNFPEGECVIEVKWTDDEGNTMFAYIRDEIWHWGDKRLLGGNE